jgi:hypothetical protein
MPSPMTAWLVLSFEAANSYWRVVIAITPPIFPVPN